MARKVFFFARKGSGVYSLGLLSGCQILEKTLFQKENFALFVSFVDFVLSTNGTDGTKGVFFLRERALRFIRLACFQVVKFLKRFFFKKKISRFSCLSWTKNRFFNRVWGENELFIQITDFFKMIGLSKRLDSVCIINTKRFFPQNARKTRKIFLSSKGMEGAKAVLKERVLEPRGRILWWWLLEVCRSLPGGLVSLGWLSIGLAPCETLLQISIPKKISCSSCSSCFSWKKIEH